jgi:hypothetical protein
VEDADNRVVIIAVDQSNKLPVRRQWSRRNPKTRLLEKEVELLGNYRKIGDIVAVFRPPSATRLLTVAARFQHFSAGFRRSGASGLKFLRLRCIIRLATENRARSGNGLSIFLSSRAFR